MRNALRTSLFPFWRIQEKGQYEQFIKKILSRGLIAAAKADYLTLFEKRPFPGRNSNGRCEETIVWRDGFHR